MIRIGVLGCAEIAHRMFMPELLKNQDFECAGIAEEYDKTKLERFTTEFGIEDKNSFIDIITDPTIDAVYVPLPPALHYRWAKLALENGKHVLLEKPSTVSYAETKELVDLAREKGLALQENYMFQYHSQLAEIKKIIASGKLGEVQLYKSSFGFPLRQANDFRYNKALGGGVLLDAAGYVTKLATILLGDTIQLDTAKVMGLPGYEVDMYGTATYSNKDGMTLQGSFSMSAYYQCSLEAWGSKGKLTTNRIFTAPPQVEPVAMIETAEGKEEIPLHKDAHFARSIEMFAKAVQEPGVRQKMYDGLEIQARLIQEIRKKERK